MAAVSIKRSILSCPVNESLLCGIFPEKLKLAKVTPVFKKGSTQDKDNYRPISVLSVFRKIFEKVMYKHRGPTQSVCVADSYFIVNVLELPFASPIAIYC